VSIWHREPNPDALNALHVDTAVSNLGIELLEFGEDSLTATMPVDARTLQPFGLLHGGASILLAETLASVGGNQVVDNEQFQCVGVSATANHLRSVRDGSVVGVARPLHLGRTTQVWDVTIRDDRDREVAACRITLAVVPLS
jgi:1,4-dihydroxy-2-naphthoyl-CoA hydrolase